MSQFKFPAAIVERARRAYQQNPESALSLLRDAELEVLDEVLKKQGKAAAERALSELAAETRRLVAELRGGAPAPRGLNLSASAIEALNTLERTIVRTKARHDAEMSRILDRASTTLGRIPASSRRSRMT